VTIRDSPFADLTRPSAWETSAVSVTVRPRPGSDASIPSSHAPASRRTAPCCSRSADLASILADVFPEVR